MEDPFFPAFFSTGQRTRVFTYRVNAFYQDCNNYSGSFTTTQEDTGYLVAISPLLPPFEGDATGTIFSRSETYVLKTADPPLTVNFHATVRLPCGPTAAAASSTQSPNQQVCGCAAYPPSHIFDANDPIVTSLRVSFYPPPPLIVGPDDRVEFPIVATCEGRRVKNAELEVTVKPEANSGGHLHDGNRPRGYLNGTEIIDSRPSIKVTTDNHGNAVVKFEPGKDLQARIRGIAGLYVVKARSTRFPYSPRSQTGGPSLCWSGGYRNSAPAPTTNSVLSAAPPTRKYSTARRQR